MNEGAIETTSEARRSRTRREITTYARRLTAKVGLQGFTVEDLCEHAGISRRTFFNYFPGKEQAVVGNHSDELDEGAVVAFLDGRPADTVGISPNLLDDLAQFAIAHMRTIGLTPDEASAFIAAAQKEPRLFEHHMRRAEEHERYLTMLVATREGLVSEHPVPKVAVALMGSLMRPSMQAFLTTGNTTPYPELLAEQIDAAKAIFAAALGDA